MQADLLPAATAPENKHGESTAKMDPTGYGSPRLINLLLLIFSSLIFDNSFVFLS